MKTIGKWMKGDVVSIQPETNLIEAAKLLAHKKVGTLPVVNQAGELVGLTSMRAISRFFLPDFINVLKDVDFVHDFGAIEDPSPVDIEKAATITVGEYMQEPFSVEEDASLTRALAIMISQDLQDIPVVRGKKLVGIASRVDIGRAFFESWLSKSTTNKTK
jgi:CBS domain-containing protein